MKIKELIKILEKTNSDGKVYLINPNNKAHNSNIYLSFDSAGDVLIYLIEQK